MGSPYKDALERARFRDAAWISRTQSHAEYVRLSRHLNRDVSRYHDTAPSLRCAILTLSDSAEAVRRVDTGPAATSFASVSSKRDALSSQSNCRTAETNRSNCRSAAVIRVALLEHWVAGLTQSSMCLCPLSTLYCRQTAPPWRSARL